MLNPVSSRLHVESTPAPTQRDATQRNATERWHWSYPKSCILRVVLCRMNAARRRTRYLQRLRLSFCAATSQVTVGARARRQSTQTRRGQQRGRSRATTADTVASSCQRKRIQDASGMPGVACRRCSALSRQRTCACACRCVSVYAPNERIRCERKRRRARPISIAAVKCCAPSGRLCARSPGLAAAFVRR